MMHRFLDTMWGQANALFSPLRRRRWVDLLLVAAAFGMLYGLILVGREWTAIQRPQLEIDLSLLALPKYTFFSMMRGVAAYVLSIAFTLVYAFWAAKDERAEKLLIPLLDILQSIPVLTFLMPLLLVMVALFPRSNMGLEITAILTIFTGQVWNMTFSLYHSLKSVPAELQEAGTVYRFTWWQRFKWVELPFATTGLAWNSMMSMAGGWFFLMINESLKVGDKDFRLPGLGSYMRVAAEQGNVKAEVLAVLAMILMIVFLDQVLWRPVVVWAQRFRIEDTVQNVDSQSWFLNLIRGSRLIRRWDRWRTKQRRNRQHRHPAPKVPLAEGGSERAAHAAPWLSMGALIVLSGFLLLGGYGVFRLLQQLPSGAWWTLLKAAGLTLSRVMASILIGLCWTLPAGLAIGLSQRLSRIFQPIVQVAASFPAPMLFPAVIAILASFRIGLGWGSIALMLLGTQWYILFNVIAGASAIPSDLREVGTAFGFSRWQRFRNLYMPAVFPYLVTGCLTAAGGAWNASIVSEYYNLSGPTLKTFGLGAIVSQATDEKDFVLLAAATLVLAGTVVLFNRLVWKPLYKIAETHYSLSK
ncbi:MAG: ABC transporter permease subunit [Geothrix sp.]|uniref:ABC transporter permease n=1 Tax=Geothrix sp. TaxID=1962974 RepID=UPI0017D82644|nr:ABC transporter permease subunit [Geothrix sp.]NWJ42311.1 ABC transporter permease subunit [Geothrix sp.]WIL19721.1 MAG: ABC transporter permease subunit [Geothrix sp.]